MKENRAISGLVILRLIVEYYSTSKQAEVVYHLTDYSRIQVTNDNLENYQTTWRMVLDGMRNLPENEVLEHFYYEAIKPH